MLNQKIKDVINSCNNIEHLEISRKWAEAITSNDDYNEAVFLLDQRQMHIQRTCKRFTQDEINELQKSEHYH